MMNHSLDRDDEIMECSSTSLPHVDRPKTSHHRKPNQSRRNRVAICPFNMTQESSPESICVDIASFHDRPKTRTQPMRRDVDEHPRQHTKRHHQSDNSHLDHTQTLQDKMFPCNIEFSQKEEAMKSFERRKADGQKTTFMQMVLAESVPKARVSLDPRASRRKIGLRKRQAASEDAEEKSFPVSTPQNIVPRLVIPADIVSDREHTLMGISRNSGSPTTPDNSSRSYYSEKGRKVLGRKPKEVSDPLDEIVGNGHVSERKYSILPSIGTPAKTQKNKGGNFQRNQLDYKRDRYESDAEFFSDFNDDMNSEETLSYSNPVPLPPIQKNSHAWNSTNDESEMEADEEDKRDRDEERSSPKIVFSERLITESTQSVSK